MRLIKPFNNRGITKGHSFIISGLRYSVKMLTLCSAVLIATAQPAYCYIDPGSGSMIWQLLVSAFIGMAFYFRKFIAGVFSRFKKSDDRP
ncbi:hypothetical protein ACOBQJ_15810 [Pelotomaculum propionicicum]|uniref:hypothetical protein n=1 Tax=Pelotomaculum propionicicum TaxID=258475 RepID=UPI003B78927C